MNLLQISKEELNFVKEFCESRGCALCSGESMGKWAAKAAKLWLIKLLKLWRQRRVIITRCTLDDLSLKGKN